MVQVACGHFAGRVQLALGDSEAPAVCGQGLGADGSRCQGRHPLPHPRGYRVLDRGPRFQPLPLAAGTQSASPRTLAPHAHPRPIHRCPPGVAGLRASHRPRRLCPRARSPRGHAQPARRRRSTAVAILRGGTRHQRRCRPSPCCRTSAPSRKTCWTGASSPKPTPAHPKRRCRRSSKCARQTLAKHYARSSRCARRPRASPRTSKRRAATQRQRTMATANPLATAGLQHRPTLTSVLKTTRSTIGYYAGSQIDAAS